MIDACKMGFTLALANGVLEGLASIQRDLIALNGVVEGSATPGKDLPVAAADLCFLSVFGEPTAKRQALPEPGNHEYAIPDIQDASDFSSRLFDRRQQDTLPPPETKLPIFSVRAFVPSADAGPARAIYPAVTVETAHSISPDHWNSAPDRSPRSESDDRDTYFSLYKFREHTPLLSITPAASVDGSDTRLPIGSGTVALPSVVISTDLPAAPPAGQDTTVPPHPSRPYLHLTQRLAASSQTDLSEFRHATSDDTTTRVTNPTADSVLPSAVPPTSDLQSTVLQGNIYVDGSRLGRWVTDHLSRAAERPRASMTGFDPRMTATWPGAPVSA
jgi:hypothetical protein